VRKAFYVLLVLIVVAIGVGFYRGWFSISMTRDSEMGRSEVHLGVDDGKMHSDAQLVKEKISGAVDRGKEKPETP